jgi:hypothetical protein
VCERSIKLPFIGVGKHQALLPAITHSTSRSMSFRLMALRCFRADGETTALSR